MQLVYWNNMKEDIKNWYINYQCKEMMYKNKSKLMRIYNIGNPLMKIEEGKICMADESKDVMYIILKQYL